MKSWKTRLLMVLTALAMVLAVSIPAIADEVDVNCDAGDEGVCTTHVTVESSQPEETDAGNWEVQEPLAPQIDDGWSPFDDLEWWPW
jgi:hypothetical protein